jgi:cytochrome d ubiquinol oxidase subunit II
MNPSWQAIAVGVALFTAMAAYAIFAGADFGGGIWDLLAGGSTRGRRAREAIDASVTPVWEGNQVWIVLGLVLLWTGFPSAFAAVTTALFVPLALSLLGILLRGVGFAFRHEANGAAAQRLTGVLFAASSVLAPFFLGACVGAVTTGAVTPHPPGNVTSAWTSATALVTGTMFVTACAYIGGVFLVGDSHRRGERDLARYFARRAAVAGAATAVLAGVNLVLLHSSAPHVFARLTGVALPLVILSVACGAAAFVLILLRGQWLLRVLGALSVTFVVAAWGLAQYPWLLPRTLALADGSAPAASLWSELAVVVLALVFVVPSFACLYWLQQHGRLVHDSASDALRRAARVQDRPEGARGSTGRDGRAHPFVSAVVALAVAAGWARAARARRSD